LMLCELMRGFRAHVNLIPYNAIGVGVTGISYRRPAEERVRAFLDVLRGAGVCAHVRVTRGEDVAAACGQLRARIKDAGATEDTEDTEERKKKD